MRNRILLATAALAAALSACGNGGDGSIGLSDEARAEAAAGFDPAAVAPEALRAAATDERARAFYEARGWRAAWTAEAAGALLGTLRDAGRHGLDPSDYVAPVEQASGATAKEAALTAAALDLADALADGKSKPNEIREIYTVPMPKVDLAAGLAGAAEAGRAAEWIESLAPQDAEYRALSEAYLRYAREAEAGGGSAIGAGESIHSGDSDPRVPAIVEVLRANGYLRGEPGQPGTAYTPAIADAVIRMQRDYGIADDGVVGPDTLEVLNTGPAERARTLAVNLERRRWLERRPPATRIDVNTAAAMLDLYRDGSHADRRRVIVGQPGWETPQLGSPIFRLVANPTWTVPKSIEEEEIAPKGAAYLRRNNMVRRDGWIVQQPGPDNALGQVKLDMQNDHAIYLHDTPAQSLFARNQRQLSHGCVRVEDAEGFARLIASLDGKQAAFDQAMATGEETFVALDRHVPVRLLYHTAFADPSGRIVFRTDPYGWDDEVASALGYDPRQARRFRTHLRDVGP